MNCEEIMELMQRYIDHDLVEAEQESLFVHLHDCPDCAASFEQLQLLSAELSSLTMVTPPFSIVDSIMPRLAEIDAEAAGIEAAYLTPKHRALNRFFSWKIATGFAAAAVIISVFAVSLTPTSNYDASDRMNQTMGVSNAKPDGTKGSVSGTAETSKAEPAAKAESTGSADATAKAGTSESSTSVDKKQLDSNYTVEGTTGLTVPSPTPLPKKSPATDSNKSLNKEANTSAPLPTRDPSQKTTAGPKASDHADMMIAPPAASASPGSTPAAAPNPSGGGYSSKNKQNTFAANGPSTDQLKSDDGQFIGSVENQTVFITTPDMNRVYTSIIQWKSTDTILLLRWLDNTKLSYQVNMEDGQIKHYIIDTIQKTEQEQ